MVDEFSAYYTEFLDGVYDCVDRIVLNAYFQMGVTPGGFRTWWRLLEGSDQNLDNTHLMRMAGHFSRRIHAYASANKIPIIHCEKGERKHEIAEEFIPINPNFSGVFVIFVSRAPAQVWDVQQSKEGKIINIAHKKSLQYVNHYSFHIMDREWGHVTIKMCGHPPFGAQIILNGHEFVACQARKEAIQFTKVDNCFTQVSNAVCLAKIADTLCSLDTIGQLTRICERWIYSSCLCFALSSDEQMQTGFHYSYSVYQAEYSRNLIFTRGSEMDQIFQGVIDRTRGPLDVKIIKTIFGAKRRPFKSKNRKKDPRLEIVVEKPTYDLTIFKIHFGKITAKMYTKGERVLRIEIIVHNSKELHCGRSLEKFPEIVLRLKGIIEQFLAVIRYMDASFISSDSLDNLVLPSFVGKTRVGGVDIQKPRMRIVLEAITALAAMPGGFCLSDLVAKVHEITGTKEYTLRCAAYDLRKLRGKNLIRKINKSRRYEVTPEGIQSAVALFTLREKVIKPVLAGIAKPKRGPKPKYQNPIDTHYDTLRVEMSKLFQALGIAG
jgi:hypothetical protein